jgi:lauroyl/myristoyl acyltransferase
MVESGKEQPPLPFRALDSAFMALFHATKALSYVLPPRILYYIPRGLGALVFYARPGMRRRLESKISDAMPEIGDPRELTRIGREACGSLFMPLFDIFTLLRHGDAYMRGLRVENGHYIDEAAAQGRGVIFSSVHVGSIGMIHAVMARYGNLYTPIAFKPENVPTPRYVEALAFYGGMLGCDVEEPIFWAGDEDIIPRITAHLAKGKRLGVVEFFGRPAAMASGVAHFAYGAGAPIVPFALLRGNTGLNNRIVLYEPIYCDPEAERRGEVKRLMREVMAASERMIREAPGQWISWFGLWQWWDEARKILESKEK